MRKGSSRRQWLAGALAALGGLFGRPRRTRAAAPARPPAPACCCPSGGPEAPLRCAVYTYDAQGNLVAVADEVNPRLAGSPGDWSGSYTATVHWGDRPPAGRPRTDPTCPGA